MKKSMLNRVVSVIDAAFKEEDHPRGDDGKFTSGGGGSSSKKSASKSSKRNSGRGPAGKSGLGKANQVLSIIDIKKKYPGKGYFINEQMKTGLGSWKSERVRRRRKIKKLEDWIEAHPVLDKDDAVLVQTRLKEIGYLNEEINILQDLEDMYF